MLSRQFSESLQAVVKRLAQLSLHDSEPPHQFTASLRGLPGRHGSVRSTPAKTTLATKIRAVAQAASAYDEPEPGRQQL